MEKLPVYKINQTRANFKKAEMKPGGSGRKRLSFASMTWIRFQGSKLKTVSSQPVLTGSPSPPMHPAPVKQTLPRF